MTIDVLQSQNLDVLFQAFYQQASHKVHAAAELFSTHYVIVPNHGIGQWVQLQLAKQQGISANQHFVEMRTFQWLMYQQVLGKKNVAEAPQMLHMKWRIYLYLSQFLSEQKDIPTALESIFARVTQHVELLEDPLQKLQKQQHLLYWIADQCSRLFANYIIYRGQCLNGCVSSCSCRQNWLALWGRNQPLALEQLIRQPEKSVADMQPELVQHALAQATEIEAWQRYIWQAEFSEDFNKIQSIEQEFWQKLTDESATTLGNKLPKRLCLFTLLELPPSQFAFIRRLAHYIPITLLHYAPSQEYWADSVDPRWKAKYSLRYPEKAALYDSHHPLLTRLGKQARDMSSLLTQLAGGEEGQWLDIFPEFEPIHLLQKIQMDILHLRQPETVHYALDEQDHSIQVHVCHSSLRQLEVLKEQLFAWLVATRHSTTPCQPSDILVLVPNLQEMQTQIRSVFGAHAVTATGHLPIKIAGVALLDAVQLWQALTLRLNLLQQRFSHEQLIDWLSLLPIQHCYQLNFDEIQRISELLQMAGFKRGFDDRHLAQSLVAADDDRRFSFRYALERLSLAIAMPSQGLFQNVLSLSDVRPADFTLIAKLLRIYQDLDKRRDWLGIQSLDEQSDIQESLGILENELNDFVECSGWQQVRTAIDKLKRVIRVTVKDREQQERPERPLKLPLTYVLDEISNSIAHQLGKTEPTGQITFAQLGQLRPLPYQLIVCLNLDTGTFPHRDHHIPFDLMELLRAELGDRSRLDDEQGAFLDAILQAQQAIWFFYNGFDVNDSEAREPSSILQELLSHLALIVSSDDSGAEKIKLQGIEVYSQLLPLYHVHPLQPFDAQGYLQTALTRYRNQWFQVAQQLIQPKQHAQHWLNTRYQKALDPSVLLDAQQWIQGLAFPPRLFLGHVGVRNIEALQQLEHYEPLLLNGIQNYQVRYALQQQYYQASSPVILDLQQQLQCLQDKLPVGKMQHATLHLALTELQQVALRLQNYGHALTTTTQQQWHYNSDVRLLLTVPDAQDTRHWISLSASSCRDERPLTIWLQYLLWRASNNSNQELQRIALFSNCTLIFAGLSQAHAMTYLAQWMQVWQIAQQRPFVVPPALFAGVGKEQLQWEVDAQGRHYPEKISELEKRWLGQRYYQQEQFNKFKDKGSYYHPDWSLLLAETEAKSAFHHDVEQYAAHLYQPLLQYVQVVEE